MSTATAFSTAMEQIYGLPLVAGFTRCYVRGCSEPTVLSRRHRVYGCVESCQGHDPARFGQARDLLTLLPETAVEAVPAPPEPETPELTKEQQFLLMFQAMLNMAQGPSDPTGGQHATLRPPLNPITPSGEALTWRL